MENTDLNYPLSPNILFKLSSDFPLVNKANNLISWIKDNQPLNTYVLFQDTLTDLGDWETFPVSHYFYLAPLFTGKPIIGGVVGNNYITNPIANTEGGWMLSMPIFKIVSDLDIFDRLLEELGIGYVVTFNNRLINLMNSSNCFCLLYYDGFFAAFRRSSESHIASVDGEGEVVRADFAINRMSFRILEAGKNASLYIRAVNYPGWSATVNGKTAQIETYYPKIPSTINWMGKVVFDYRVPFMRIALPPGDSEIVLEYRRVTSGTHITMAGLIVFVTINAFWACGWLRSYCSRK